MLMKCNITINNQAPNLASLLMHLKITKTEFTPGNQNGTAQPHVNIMAGAWYGRMVTPRELNQALAGSRPEWAVTCEACNHGDGKGDPLARSETFLPNPPANFHTVSLPESTRPSHSGPLCSIAQTLMDALAPVQSSTFFTAGAYYGVSSTRLNGIKPA